MKPSPEVSELINETKKQLEHLRALGVENIRLMFFPLKHPRHRLLT